MVTNTRRAILAGGIAALAAAPALAGAPHPDAELLRLRKEYDAAFKRTSTKGSTDEEFESACDDLEMIEFAIQDAPAHTLEGLAVKAHVAKTGDYCLPALQDRSLDAILSSLVDDILRLTT